MTAAMATCHTAGARDTAVVDPCEPNPCPNRGMCIARPVNGGGHRRLQSESAAQEAFCPGVVSPTRRPPPPPPPVITRPRPPPPPAPPPPTVGGVVIDIWPPPPPSPPSPPAPPPTAPPPSPDVRPPPPPPPPSPTSAAPPPAPSCHGTTCPEIHDSVCYGICGTEDEAENGGGRGHNLGPCGYAASVECCGRTTHRSPKAPHRKMCSCLMSTCEDRGVYPSEGR